MSGVGLLLVTIASIFLLGAMGEAVFKRTNVPDVVWLIVAGMIVGPFTGLVSRAQLIQIAPYFAALTLVVVLFEGGTRLKLAGLSTAAPRSGLLAVLTFLFAAGVVAIISMVASMMGVLPAEWSWKHSLMLGSILGGSSSIIIMPAMAQARVEPPIANLVNLESAFTDAFCVVGASAMINLILGGEEGMSPGLALAQSFGIGLAIGALAGLLWLVVMRKLSQSDHAYPITLSALLLLFVLIEHTGGSAALGILTFAIIVGNAESIGGALGFTTQVELHSDVRGFHSQMTFIVKSFFFTFIGAMLSPPWGLIIVGVVLGLALLAARAPGVWLSMLGTRSTPAQKRLVIVAMPRGMAAGVLATMPAAAGVSATQELPTVVFATVFTTIVIFAIGFPWGRSAMKREASSEASTETALAANPEPSELAPELSPEPSLAAAAAPSESPGASLPPAPKA